MASHGPGAVPDGTADQAARLAARLLGGQGLLVGWGGRVRVVAPAHGPVDRWRAANTAPAYRLSARAFRSLLAARVALSAAPRIETDPIDLAAYLPTSLRHLRPASVIVGTPGLRRSLVVRLIDQRRSPRAALKIAVTPIAGEGILHETGALQDARLAGRAPELLHVGEIAGRYAMVTAHVPGRPLQYSARGIAAATAFCCAPGATTTTVAATDHPWITNAVAAAGADLDTLIPALPGPFALTRTHGDFAPWNLLATSSTQVVAIDWENSAADGLPAADLAHFVMASERLLRRSAPTTAAAKAASVLVEQLGHDRSAAWTIVGLAASATAQRERTTGGHEDTIASWEAAARHALSLGT